jgi:ceramide glucosyltransferase
MSLIDLVVVTLGFVCLTCAVGYALLALVAVRLWQIRRTATTPTQLPPVTLLKPLCGAEPGLYDNLRSFCLQDYPTFQIVFGVRDEADPALQVARRLLAEFPSLQIDVVVNPRQHGSNFKISNMINMLAQARHDLLVMADSDARVRPDYLRVVTAPLLDRSVGLVTCVYRGIPTRPICSRLGAMYVNEWYMPSVLLARLFGHQGYASGQTLGLRRETLQAIGGLPAIANHLAEDHRLGELVRALGLRIALSSYMPVVEHHEPDWDSLSAHETRWMCTLRVLQPASYRMIFLSFSAPLAILGVGLLGAEASLSTAAWSLFATTMTARVILHFLHRMRDDRSLLADLWLLPARELLICWIWFRSFFTSRVRWRGNEFDIGADGLMRRAS